MVVNLVKNILFEIYNFIAPGMNFFYVSKGIKDTSREKDGHYESNHKFIPYAVVYGLNVILLVFIYGCRIISSQVQI